jgi:serine protease Do
MTRRPRWPLAAGTLVLGVAIGACTGGSLLRGQPQPGPGDPPPQGAPAAVLSIPRELTSYSSIVDNVLPAVVSIESRVKARRPARRGADPADRDMQDRPERPDLLNLGFGSGFLIDPRGIVLTNFHVVEGADSVEVELTDGKKYVSSDIKSDRLTDLAIIRLRGTGPFPYLQFGDSDKMRIGDRVLAVGAPFGLTGSVTHGIVSAKGRDLKMNQYEDFLQTDAAINPGNSGGPLVNLEGKVIGINSAIKSRSGGWQGIGLAATSNLARPVVDQLLQGGVVKRGYLGIRMGRDVDEDAAVKLGLKVAGGVVVSRVLDESPAAKGGLQSGDVVLNIGGRAVKDGRDLQRAVANLTIGKAIEVTVVRDGQPVKLRLVPEEQPQDMGRTKSGEPE